MPHHTTSFNSLGARHTHILTQTYTDFLDKTIKQPSTILPKLVGPEPTLRIDKLGSCLGPQLRGAPLNSIIAKPKHYLVLS